KAADEKKDEKKDDKKDDKKSADAKPGDKTPDEQKDEKKAEPVKPIQIDLDGISTRIATVPISAGILNGLAARKDKFFYLSTPQEARQFGTNDRTPKSILHVYEVSKREDKVLLEGIDGYDLDKEGKKVISQGWRRQAQSQRTTGQDRSPRRVAPGLPRSLAHRARLLLGSEHDRPQLEENWRAL
ncbi:MAG: hypothetical protein DMG56_15475, partial [Acidobacteria bacterium]